MKGGVILFRGRGAAACRYLESDRSRADDYYLEDGATLATFTVTDAAGEIRASSTLDAETYAGWVDWIDPLTGASMGTPRLPGEEGTSKHGSPRFAEMVVNAPKSLSIAAALHPDVSDALDAAQADAVAEIRRFLALHSVTRVGPRGRQEVVPVERLQIVAVVHKTSRAGDPHRHVHFQVGTRVWAAGKWRGLDTAALFKQQGAIRALGTAVLAAHPGLANTLGRHGLTLDPVTGEAAELEPFNAVMSKRAAQVEKNLATAEAVWDESRPGQEPGPIVHARMIADAWAKDRPQKRPTTPAHEEGWRRELADAGFDPDRLPRRRLPTSAPASPDELEIQSIASRALDRCAAAASTWTRHTVQEHVTRVLTDYGVRAAPTELRELVELATDLAVGDCLSVLAPGTIRPEHVAHLTSLQVIAAETKLRDLLTAAVEAGDAGGYRAPAHIHSGLDDAQAQAAAAAIASTDPLVVVEGAAGAGKTTMLGAAITIAAGEGRATRLVTPTKKAADVAVRELGVPAESVAKLLHAHGWRWNDDGVWNRDHTDVPAWAQLARGERIVVDEAGMLDQDSAIALLTLAAEARATVALVGDRAQLPAVGRGGVLDIAVAITIGAGGTVHDLDTVHRFADPEYAELTAQMRAGRDPGGLFNNLHGLGLIQLHDSDESAHEQIATAASAEIASERSVAATVSTNEEASDLNARIRARRMAYGNVDDTATATGRDGLLIGVGDVIATRKNDSDLGVANRQTWTVQHVDADGSLTVAASDASRRRQRSVMLPGSYVAEHVHLAYAATGYGVQGITTTTSHTLLSDSLDAAGVYVGMTRGRDQNVLHIVADNLADAREQFVDALERDRADRGLQVATADAHAAVTGLSLDGPAKVVNDERARLAQQIANAEHEAARWERAARLIAVQAQTHAHEEDAAAAGLTQAQAHLTTVRNQVIAPLLAQAIADGRPYLDAGAREYVAWQGSRSAGRLGRRAAQRRLDVAHAQTSASASVIQREWGSLPPAPRHAATTWDTLEQWAAQVADHRADADPSVARAGRQVTRTEEDLKEVRWRHREEVEMLSAQIYGRSATPFRARSGPNSAEGRSTRWQAYVAELREDLDQIESLPIGRAVHFIETRHAQRHIEAAEIQPSRDRERLDGRAFAPLTPPGTDQRGLSL